MGKVPKVVKTVEKTENKSKVKKLINNPGIIKASAKLNLKETRVPLSKILKNKPQIVDENVNSLNNTKSIKTKKSLSKSNENSVKPKLEQISIMKTLKRKSTSENTVKLPLPKKKGASPVAAVKKETKKILKKEIENEAKKPKTVITNKDRKVDEEILEKKTEPQPVKKDIMTINKGQVIEGVSAVLKLAKLQGESKKKLFDGEHQPIFLQVSCIKVPKVPRRRLRMMLPHTLVTDTDDVVLFVGDMKKGRAQDFEPTINHYQDILREKGCTQVKDVIPLTQVKTEYDQYELKRKLLSSYDYFLTDGKIAGHLSHLLGKIFITKRKLPTSIKMDSKNLKLDIDNALRKTSMELHSNGNSHIIQVAHTAMKKSEILNNILYVSKNLAQNYPGGWDNIRSLILKTPTSLPVPIYMTLKSKNKVKVPVVLPTRPKAHRVVSGELSTAPGNTRVTVKPDGTVTVQQYKKSKEDEEEVDESAVKSSKKTATDKSAAKQPKLEKKKITKATESSIKSNKKTKKNDESSKVSANLNAEDSKELSKQKAKTKKFEDSDEEIEEAEQAYLSQWQEESTTATTEEKKPKKKAKIVKKKKTKV